MNKKVKKNNNKNGHTFNDCVIKIKNSSNKLENNINDSFNKSNKIDLLNNNKVKIQKDESNKKENKILKLLKNKIFITLSSTIVILSLAAPSIYFPVTTFIKNQNSNSISKIENGYTEKLNFLNQLPNETKIKIWNSYIDETNFRWDIKEGNRDIWAYIKNNFEFFQNPKETCVIDGQNFSIKEALNFILNDLSNHTNNYLDITTFRNTYEKQSFLNLTKSQDIFFSSKNNVDPILSFHTSWNGIPQIVNSSGITTKSIKINFERNELGNFQMSINFNYAKGLENPSIPAENKENYRNVPFVAGVKVGRSNVAENKGWVYNIKPINNTLKVGVDFSPSFYNFNAWIINYFDTIII